MKTVEANEGDDILAIAHEYDVDLEGIFFALLLQFKQACSQPSFISLLLPDIPRFSIPLSDPISTFYHSGACEGSVACSTCHVILPEKFYDLLPEPDDDENDMLDMAFGLTDTSRLGCQVKMTKELDGITCTLPSATRNMFVDGMCFLSFFYSCYFCGLFVKHDHNEPFTCDCAVAGACSILSLASHRLLPCFFISVTLDSCSDAITPFFSQKVDLITSFIILYHIEAPISHPFGRPFGIYLRPRRFWDH